MKNKKLNNSLEIFTVLYIDNKMISTEMRSLFKLLNVNILFAKNIDSGLTSFLVNKETIHLVFINISSIQNDTINGLKQIRENNSNIPIIISISNNELRFIKTLIEIDINEYILKPINISNLKIKIIRSIDQIIIQRKIFKIHKELFIEKKKNKMKDDILLIQSKLALMGEMINMITHQWRQPLSSIGTASFNMKNKLLLNKFDLNTKQGRIEQRFFYINKLDEIENYVQSLTTTIDDFINFLNPEKKIVFISIEKIIRDALNIVSELLKLNDIKVRKSFHNTSIYCYPNEILHVILNLLNNSKDSFLENNIKNKNISIETLDSLDSIIIKISDNAGGIKKEIIGKIFSPYFSTKKEKNGMGIGLYMSKVIIEKNHGGSFFAENIDDGVVFNILLPKNKSKD